MPDVEHHHILLTLNDAKDYPINVRLMAKKQLSEFVALRRYRTAVGMIFQSAYGSLEISIPLLGRTGMLGVDTRIDEAEVALSARQGPNLIFHA